MSFKIKDLQQHNSDLLLLLTQHLPDMLWVKDLDGKYIYVNQAMCDGLLMAKDTNEPIGKDDVFFAHRERELHKEDPNWHTFGELCFSSDIEVIADDKAMKIEEYGNVKGKLLFLEVYKAPFYDKDGKIIGTVGAGRDITQLKKNQIDLQKSLKILDKQKKELEYQASHDSLTALPNRILFMDRLEQSINVATAHKKELAILFIDFDHFKEINDSLGHYIGDEILIKFTKRITKYIQKSDTLSRFGGDDFSVILNDISSIDSVTNFIVDIMELLKKPFMIQEKELYVGMSIGVSMFPSDGTIPNTLLKNADAAMYKAKENGRNTYSFYNEEMTKKATDRVDLETQLRKAMLEDEFLVYFQPQTDARKKKLVGMEALVRWNHPTRGLLSPDQFIPIAELSDLIVELDRIVMKKAMAQFNIWSKRGLYPGKLAMNLPMKQIQSEDFLEFMEVYLRNDNRNYHNIELEVTESQIMSNPEKSIKVLQRLHDLGVAIAIDDFGTGYSSLAYLKRLPISKLKIDKSFVDNLPYDAEDVAISKTIINLCQSLNLKVIAEGVETEEQNDFLVENGCSFIQGYLYSKPLSAADMSKYLEKEKEKFEQK